MKHVRRLGSLLPRIAIRLLLGLAALLSLLLPLAAPVRAGTAPAAPSNLALNSFPTPTSIQLRWTDNSTNENSYTIERNRAIILTLHTGFVEPRTNLHQ